MKIRHLGLMSLFIITNAAFAADINPIAGTALSPMVQRNCPIGSDLDLTDTTVSAFSECIWLENDDNNIQSTLHIAKDISFIYADCHFTTVGTDHVNLVAASKSGNSDGSAHPMPLLPSNVLINGNNIQFILRNFNTVFDDAEKQISHLNVLFYLDKQNYTGEDTITCTYYPVKSPV